MILQDIWLFSLLRSLLKCLIPAFVGFYSNIKSRYLLVQWLTQMVNPAIWRFRHACMFFLLRCSTTTSVGVAFWPHTQMFGHGICWLTYALFRCDVTYIFSLSQSQLKLCFFYGLLLAAFIWDFHSVPVIYISVIMFQLLHFSTLILVLYLFIVIS